MKKKFIISLIIIFLIAITSLYLKNLKKKETKTIEKILPDETPYSSNIIENVYYSSKDTKGNEYIIEASKGEIDYDNSNIVFLSNVNETSEMVEMVAASRSFQNNVEVVTTAKQLMMRTLDITKATKELSNGRLAMIGVFLYMLQEFVTQQKIIS